VPDKVEMANVALRMIGEKTITSFTQSNSTPATAVNNIYNETLAGLLAAGHWKFASVKVKLGRLSTAPAYGFDYAYELPSDWVRTNSVSNNDAGTGTMIYREGQVGSKRILESSAEDIYLDYVKLETDPNIMTPLFRKALILALAQILSISLASSNVMEEQLSKKAKRALGHALSVDALGSTPETRPRGSWVDARSSRWR